jgi:TolA-binding protein
MLGNCHSGFIQNQTVARSNKLSDFGQAGMAERFNVVRLLRHCVPRHDNKNLIFFMAIIIVASFQFNSSAQSTRGLINDGVDFYKEQKFADAEVNFKKGTEKNPESFEAKFNLGDAYYKQQRYDEAIKTFQSSFVNAKNDEEKAKIYHNIGNSLLKSQKVKESMEHIGSVEAEQMIRKQNIIFRR